LPGSVRDTLRSDFLLEKRTPGPLMATLGEKLGYMLETLEYPTVLWYA